MEIISTILMSIMSTLWVVMLWIESKKVKGYQYKVNIKFPINAELYVHYSAMLKNKELPKTPQQAS